MKLAALIILVATSAQANDALYVYRAGHNELRFCDKSEIRAIPNAGAFDSYTSFQECGPVEADTIIELRGENERLRVKWWHRLRRSTSAWMTS